jgi:hypothetical protein
MAVFRATSAKVESGFARRVAIKQKTRTTEKRKTDPAAFEMAAMLFG